MAKKSKDLEANKKPKSVLKKEDVPKREPDAIAKAVCATSVELHLQQYPAFYLTPDKPTDNCITFSETIYEGGVAIQRDWSIYAMPAFGWPGEHEAEVWRSIEHIVHLRRVAGTLTNPIKTTLTEIREHMSGKNKGGTDFKRIMHSLSCLQGTAVKTSFFYQSNEKSRSHYDFSLIASLAATEKILSNKKKVIDQLYIELPDRIFENIQNSYIRPLDKGFRDNLGKWISKRLYELLGVKFYALRAKNAPYRTRYSRLCALLGIVKQKFLSDARRILGRAHDELRTEGFLEKVEWYAVSTDQKDWVLCYWPGPRAKSEWKKDYWTQVKLPELLVVEELTEGSLELVWVDEAAPNEMAIKTELISKEEEHPQVSKAQPFTAALEVSKFPEISKPTKPTDKKAQAEQKERQTDEGLEEDVYAKMAINAFEEGLGSLRKIGELTVKERKTLKVWMENDIRSSDIETGAHNALKQQMTKASQAGKAMEPILSLAYISGHVMEVANERVKKEKELAQAIKLAKLKQNDEMKEQEIWLKQEAKNVHEFRAFYKNFIEPLVLVKSDEGYFLFVSPMEEPTDFFRREGILKFLSGKSGSSVFVLGVMDWARRMKANAI